MLKKIFKMVLPKGVIEKIIDVKNNYFEGYATKSYSQEGEDMILRRLFENQTTGFYIDVGAHHPKRFSNTYYFYKKGWRGINIDAMPGSMKVFNKIRPRDINIEKAISDQKQILTYYIFNEPALNGFSRELSEKRNNKSDYYIKDTINMETSTLEEILDQYLPPGQEIDFLSIDVEGLDFAVLKSINLNKYTPKVILIEILASNLESLLNDQVTLYLKDYGYIPFAKTFNTVIYIQKLYLNGRRN